MGTKFIKSGLMMAILCHCDQDTGCPDIWLNKFFFLSLPVRIFLNEISIESETE